ncbi:MAG: NosD domain-containing protein [Methanothrix sp.]
MRACLILILIPILVLGYADASKITVGPKDADYSHIQQAIDNSSQGDVIEVQSGLYRENVYVSKTLTLKGIDSGNGLPVVDAGGSGSVISIASGGTIVEGFNITGSGGCGCGNAGIKVVSSNNIVQGNIIHKNKYGIYIQSGNENNTFISNDLLDNEITVSESGSNNRWNGSVTAGGLQGLLEMISGPQVKGNHYSDYDEVYEGCNDTNQDKICDMPKKIGSGPEMDNYPSVSPTN